MIYKRATSRLITAVKTVLELPEVYFLALNYKSPNHPIPATVKLTSSQKLLQMHIFHCTQKLGQSTAYNKIEIMIFKKYKKIESEILISKINVRVRT